MIFFRVPKTLMGFNGLHLRLSLSSVFQFFFRSLLDMNLRRSVLKVPSVVVTAVTIAIRPPHEETSEKCKFTKTMCRILETSTGALKRFFAARYQTPEEQLFEVERSAVL